MELRTLAPGPGVDPDKPISLAMFWDALDRFDWFYPFSDDPRVYRSGHSRNAALMKLAGATPKHVALYIAFRDFVFSGPPWGTEKAPKPERPAE